jgi:predicted HicB family RNase H-like nuclease
MFVISYTLGTSYSWPFSQSFLVEFPSEEALLEHLGVLKGSCRLEGLKIYRQDETFTQRLEETLKQRRAAAIERAKQTEREFLQRQMASLAERLKKLE